MQFLTFFFDLDSLAQAPTTSQPSKFVFLLETVTGHVSFYYLSSLDPLFLLIFSIPVSHLDYHVLYAYLVLDCCCYHPLPCPISSFSPDFPFSSMPALATFFSCRNNMPFSTLIATCLRGVLLSSHVSMLFPHRSFGK